MYYICIYIYTPHLGALSFKIEFGSPSRNLARSFAAEFDLSFICANTFTQRDSSTFLPATFDTRIDQIDYVDTQVDNLLVES